MFNRFVYKNTVAHHNVLRRMFAPTEPFTVSGIEDQAILHAKHHYELQGETFHLARYADKDGLIAKGFRLAHYPGTRREIWIVPPLHPQSEHVVMLGPKSGRV